MSTPSLPSPSRPCRVCAQPTTLAGGRCDKHTQQKRTDHNTRTKYYRSAEWRYLRAETIKRDHERCVICAGTHRLTAHHIHARKDGGPDELSNLVTLDQNCHSKLEQGDPITRRLLASHLTESPYH